LNVLLKNREAVRQSGPKDAKLIKNLEEAQLKGYALNDEKLIKGLRSIAAPIFNAQGDVEGTINIPVFQPYGQSRRID
jgi:IclR family pca regulon transcriptional regulator